MSISTLDGDAEGFSSLQLLEEAKALGSEGARVLIIFMDKNENYEGTTSNMTLAQRSYSLIEAMFDNHLPELEEDE